MRFSIISVFCLATAAFAQDDAPTTTIDIGNLPSQLSQLAALLPTLPPNWQLPKRFSSLQSALPTPPPGIAKDVLAAIPTSVLRGLVNPASRSALQAQVASDGPPQWYEELPTSVKNYFGLFATQIADRSITYNPSAAVATNGSIEASTGDDDDDEHGSGGEAWDLNEAVQDKDDSGAMAAFERKAVSSSVLVALGIFGVALAL
ncbi:hypothetical protein BJX68DRAFT_276161 [Aspergillus pseudodeflectus]|uniref:Uncharacterized protein n=1 Tax=Aspergillus pseudodeflectus TaxID=176178 RepID=A0ABR4K9K7_9EURO